MPENQTCPNCGAPLYTGRSCEFCGDTRVEADRQQNCRTFIVRINEKLLFVPPLAGWGVLMGGVGIPLLFILFGVGYARSIIAWVVFIGLALLSIPMMAIVAAGLREKYQTKLFYEVLYPFIENFMNSQKYTLPEFISEGQNTLRGSTKPPFLKFVTDTMAISREQYFHK